MANGHPDGPVRKKLIDLAEIGLPVPALTAIVMSVFLGGWWVNDKMHSLELRFLRNEANITRNTVDPHHVWRRWDMALWCARAQRMNKDFKCPDPYGQPSAAPKRRGK